ncbi:UNKNOWN [Stylonychia lemnae]|uniref:Transmembrane protein n=1 Tax=Stylonychia lemnae TaxID=5949 RepID=A0A078A2U8_STYLE|nr:UNKNOWN [Stylonychia lemnae]|eukprot:CDW76435.1 UNKNOWN [Stylonychia lemnae]
MDGFGYPIALTYKNSPTYKSFLGGFATLVTRVLIGTYLLLFNSQKDALERMKIAGNHLCLHQDFNATLKATRFSEQNKYLAVKIAKCNQEFLEDQYPGQNLTCKSDEEITHLADEVLVQIVYMYEHFDENDYNDSVKPQMNSLYFGLSVEKRLVMIKRVQKNLAQMKDSYFASSLHFFQREYYDIISDYEYRTPMLNDGIFASIQYYQSFQQETVQRSAYTILDDITNTGGFMSIIFAFVNLLINRIQRNLFFQSLIKRNYLVYENPTLSQGSLSKKAKIDQNQDNSNNSIQDFSTISHDKANDQFENDFEWQFDKNKDQREGTAFVDIFKYMKNLQPFKFSYYRYRLLNMLKICKMPNNYKTNYYNEKKTQYQRGQRRLEIQFDIDSILKKLKTLDLLQDIMISKYQRKLFPFLSSNVISIDSKDLQSRSSFKQLVVDEDIQNYLRQVEIQKESNKIDSRLFKNLFKSQQLSHKTEDHPQLLISQIKSDLALDNSTKSDLGQNIIQRAVKKAYTDHLYYEENILKQLQLNK